MDIHNFHIEELRKKYTPFLDRYTDIYYHEFSRIICESINNYLDKVDKSLSRFLENNGNNEDLLYIKDWIIKHKLHCISSRLRVNLEQLINSVYFSTANECREKYEKIIEKEIEKSKFDSVIFFSRNFRRYPKKDRSKIINRKF